MNLLLLAPQIQEEVVDLEYPAGREPITDRLLRRLLERLVWTSGAVGGAQAVGLVNSRTRSL